MRAREAELTLYAYTLPPITARSTPGRVILAAYEQAGAIVRSRLQSGEDARVRLSVDGTLREASVAFEQRGASIVGTFAGRSMSVGVAA